jgi:cold-inducible RNA-binding protein
MASKIYVGGLSYSTTSDGLREHFSQCGTVTSAEVVTDRDSSQSRGFGFVEMASDAEAQEAIAKLNDQPLDGRPLRVNVAKPRAERSNGGGGGRRW